MQEICEAGGGPPPDPTGMPDTTPPPPDGGGAQAEAEVDLLEGAGPAEPAAPEPQANCQSRPASDHHIEPLNPENFDAEPDATAVVDETSGGTQAETEGGQADGPATDSDDMPGAGPSPSRPEDTDPTPVDVAAYPEVAAADPGGGVPDIQSSGLAHTLEPTSPGDQVQDPASPIPSATRRRCKPRGATGADAKADPAGLCPAEPAGKDPLPRADSVDRPGRRGKKGTGGRAATDEDRKNVINKAVDDIRAEQQKIHKGEGIVVASKIAIGTNLKRLKDVSNRDWGKRLESLEIHPRVASRLMKVAEPWGNGRIASDLLPMLPVDDNKLEWLCQLDEQQLQALLQERDCKKASRKEVTAWVQTILGEPAKARKGRKSDPIKAVVQQFDRFAERLINLKPDPGDEASEDQYRASLRDGIKKLRQNLEIS